MPYNPFHKPIGETLTIDDLQLLITRSVSEGYFVEYKSQMQSNEKIAKSIAALANTYGGWYFIGVEADKTHNVATKISGFSVTTHPDPIAIVREVAKSRISPTPVFYPQVVNVTSDLVVLVVYVPEEQDTPFITSNGKIYRRIADSSDPTPEKDRYAVDRLYDRQRQHAKQFERFCRDTRKSFASDNTTWLTVALSPYPSGLINRYPALHPEKVEQLFLRSQLPLDLYLDKKSKLGDATLAFGSVQPTHESVLLRHVEPFYIGNYSATLELFANGSTKFLIPFTDSSPYSYQHDPYGRVSENLNSSKVKEALQQFLEMPSPRVSQLVPSIDHLRFFDIGQLWKTMFLYLNFYLDWLGDDLSL